MRSFSFWRVLGVVLLLLLLALGLGGWLLSSHYARPYVKRLVREQLTHNSELVLAPFEVDFSVWNDFPYLSASLSHLTLTDTAHHRAVPVMRLGRADLRLNLRELLHRRVQVTRLTLHDVAIGQRVDSVGHSWGLRGKKRTSSGPAPKIDLALDSIVIYNFGIFTRNDFTQSILRGRIYQARVAATLRQGILAVHGRFAGRLVQLHNRSGDLLTNEPVNAWLNYTYNFEKRQGTFARTRATLNGDTIRISGTHTAAVAVGNQPPAGTVLNLRFAGSQPLLAVLHAALPPTLHPILHGARSPSKAQIDYRMTGLSGPLVRPRVTLRFGLRNARIAWPDSARRIDRWDLQGTYDNGPAHLPKTMSLNLSQCRIYSPAGQLDMAFLLRDFRHPRVQGRLHGRTTLPALMGLLSPERWYASRGIADLDVRIKGLLPVMSQLRRGDFRRNLSVRGTATLRDADFRLNGHDSGLRNLNVRIGLNDSLWRLSNASGMLAGMKFKASATTTYLLDYFTGQHPTTTIKGSFAVDELDVSSLRQLLRPSPGSSAYEQASRRTRLNQADRRRIATTLGSHMVPPGMLLDVALRCDRLALATDTLRELAVRIRHDGERVQLSGIRGKLWDGEVRGEAQWLTDSSARVVPVAYNIDFKFDTLNYKSLLERLSRPPRRSTKTPGSPAIRELLLAANGKLSYEINSLVLPDGQRLRNMRLRFDKQGPMLRLPYVYFMTPQGGVGSGSATVQVAGLRIESADASLHLRYPSLDVPELLRMLASVAPPATDSAAAAARRAQRAQRASRRAARQAPGTPARTSLIADGRFTALLRVEADRVSYGAVQGTRFQLVTHLQEGEAMLDECTVNTLGGRVTLRGRLITNAGRHHHPLRVQALLEDIQLPTFFDLATSLNLNVLSKENIKGTLRAAVALRTDLDEKFIPSLDNTNAYLKVDLRDLELIEVEALQDAFKFFKKRTGHLFFEPVSTEFVLSRGELLIPNLRLDSNLTELQINGRYDLAGPADLYIGMNPLHAILGSNNKRIARIQAGESTTRHDPKLSYVNLTRDAPRSKYRVKIFQKQEQRQEQVALRRQLRQFVITQRLDTTLRLLPGSPFAAPTIAAPDLATPVPKLATSP
ncbi:AsmA-like C-terminal region-containing protein [Hymenobacter sp. H14-R3]|uniref:AsmA-like C-terminal region-containing protein n=1 Tax=Hymenobacter sp. H14-R3 TaxID=3046308 RepID=UPI0024B8AED0|nr:AsmA-like C-terminal region-containing protein [Hymenobacter sp. H14-R3]MDJ0364633.1 AsmA-like C-terminal region-containing protein [Hymenobacter sp. H14-R3]